MPVFESLYAAGMAAVRRLSPTVSGRDSKLGRGVDGRRIALESIERWSEAHRDPARPLVWVHAPSVGEGLQARAVIESSQARAPDRCQWAFTHFSPSAETLAARIPVDWSGYLPWDVEADVTRALAALRPSVVVFTKTEVWPVLSRTAAAWGIPTALIAGTLPASSSRVTFPARPVLRPSMERLQLVAAVADGDAERFVAAGVRPDVVRVLGDPGVDSAAQRAAAADPAAPFLQPFHALPRPTLVAGSTWPADEAVLVPALTAVRSRRPEFRLIVAPHEPDRGHVDPLLAALRREGWDTMTLGEVEAGATIEGIDAVVVDRVGALAHLYTVGAIAYVGGGFHDAGLHSVLEPAAAGIPCVFGPRHRNARAAGELLGAGAAAEVGDARSLEGVVSRWLEDDGRRGSAGGAAAAWIDAHRGASDRTADALLALVGP
jgi:3-deoxy-D-manno-octulosonic-acid transferase